MALSKSPDVARGLEFSDCRSEICQSASEPRGHNAAIIFSHSRGRLLKGNPVLNSMKDRSLWLSSAPGINSRPPDVSRTYEGGIALHIAAAKYRSIR
jgi:hypothetical protein